MTNALYSFLLAAAVPSLALAQPYRCVFDNGSIAEIRYPCDAVTVDRFAKRLAQLLPDPRDMPGTRDEMKSAFVVAIGGCDDQTRGRTPEELGKAGEPFLPWKQTAAMVQAARELFCPEIK